MTNGFRRAFTGLALLYPASGQTADVWANAEPVTVVMADNSFQPSQILFHAGKPYALRLENRGKNLHEFTAPGFLKASTFKDKRVLSNGGTDIVVQAGKSATVFLIAPAKGQYELTCADHDWDGMTGGITVD